MKQQTDALCCYAKGCWTKHMRATTNAVTAIPEQGEINTKIYWNMWKLYWNIFFQMKIGKILFSVTSVQPQWSVAKKTLTTSKLGINKVKINLRQSPKLEWNPNLLSNSKYFSVFPILSIFLPLYLLGLVRMEAETGCCRMLGPSQNEM